MAEQILPKSSHWIIALESHFPGQSWSWMAAALRQDVLIWNSLDQEGLGKRGLAVLSNTPEQWSPAVLALLSLDYAAPLESLRTLPLRPISQPVRHRVIQTFEEWVAKPDTNLQSLGQAGMIALALREKRVNDSWERVLTLLDLERSGWQTVLACLYGMIPDPYDMLRVLLHPTGTPFYPDLVIHTLLSNPLSADEQGQVFTDLLEDLAFQPRLLFLRRLARQRPAMSAQLAAKFVESSAFTTQRYRQATNQAESTLALPDWSAHLRAFDHLLQASEAYQVADQVENAVPLISEALGISRRLQASMAAHLACLVSAAGYPDSAIDAWKQAALIEPDNPTISTGMALALIQSHRLGDAQAYLDSRLEADATNQHPSQWVTRARLARISGLREEARQASQRAYFLILEQEDLSSLRSGLMDLSPILVEELYENGLPAEAAHIAEMVLKDIPDDPQILSWLARAYLSVNAFSAALSAATLSAALQPGKRSNQYLLIETQEAAGEWQAALTTRRLLLDETKDQASQAELHAIALCALKANQPVQAIQPCRQAIERNPDDGLAYAYLGQAQFALGDQKAALDNFLLATELLPQLAGPWLALAEAYQHAGLSEKSHEVLRAASQAAPNAPAIHLALGKAYLEESSPTQALASLRRAASLLQEPEGVEDRVAALAEEPDLPNQIAFFLGQTLRQLGHLDEACQVFESAYQIEEQEGRFNPDLAFAYAQTLIGLNILQTAIRPLQQVVASQPDDPQPYLDLARCILLINPVLPAFAQQAVESLRKVLELDPQRVEALGLLGDACAAADDYQAALEAYLAAYDTTLLEDPSWHARLALGIGRTCLASGEAEKALVYLKEASQIDNLNPLVYEKLAETCLRLNLLEDSLQYGRIALQLNPIDLETMCWFADQIQDLYWISNGLVDALPEAIQTLTQAIQIAPGQIALSQKLGDLYIEAGNSDSALRTYRELAVLADAPENCLTCLDLFQIARNLRKLGDAEKAIDLIEKAITITIADLENTQAECLSELENPILIDLWVELALAHTQTGADQSALDALEHAIERMPEDAWLYIRKADLLIEIGRPDEALLAIEMAIIYAPESSSLHLRAANLLYQLGKPAEALKFAETSLQTESDEDPPALLLQARCLAATLYRSLLRPDRFENLIRDAAITTDNKEALFEYHALCVELGLDLGDEELVCYSISSLAEIHEDHPRVQALQARQAGRNNDMDSALELLNRSLRWVSVNPTADGFIDPDALAIQRAQAEAALELGRWSVAIPLFQHLANLLPGEPLAQLQLGRAIVLRADAQVFSQAAQVVEHAPGAEALSDTAYSTCQVALQAASIHLLDTQAISAGRSIYNPAAPTRWQARMEVSFKPGSESAILFDAVFESMPVLPDDIAAKVVNMGKLGEPAAAGRAAQTYPRNPLVWSRQAMILSQNNVHQALSAINRSMENWGNQVPGFHYEMPILKAFQASLAFKNHELETAREAIQSALQSWPDEPRWHALLAELELQLAQHPDQPEAVRLIALRTATNHLEQAAHLEPNYYHHLLRLGQVYLDQQAAIRAVQVLEEASQLDPEQADTWLALAQAYKATGNLEEAALAADRALAEADDQSPALLLLAEVALESENFRLAYTHSQAALRLLPDDPNGLYWMARSLEGLNRPAEALATMDKLIQITPQPFNLELERTRLLEKAQGEAACLEALCDLVDRYPQEPVALASLAKAMLASGQINEAIQTAQQALQNSQGKLTTHEEADLNFLIGHHSIGNGQLDLAIHYLSAAIELVPDHLDAYLDLGAAFQERRQPALALETYKQAINIAPHDYRPYYQAGLVMKEVKDYQSAEQMLTRASSLAPNELSIHRLLAAVVALNLIHNRRIPATSPSMEE